MRLAIVASVIFGLGVIGGGVSAAMTADLPKEETPTGTFTLSHGSGVIPPSRSAPRNQTIRPISTTRPSCTRELDPHKQHHTTCCR